MAKQQKPAGKGGGEAQVGFEEAVARLESIIERIERGEVGLEESLREYEAGVGLIKRCREILERAEQRIEELSAAASGEAAASSPAPPAGGRGGRGSMDAPARGGVGPDDPPF